MLNSYIAPKTLKILLKLETHPYMETYGLYYKLFKTVIYAASKLVHLRLQLPSISKLEAKVCSLANTRLG